MSHIVDVPDDRFQPGETVTALGVKMTFVSRRRNLETGAEWFDLTETRSAGKSLNTRRRSAPLGKVRKRKNA